MRTIVILAVAVLQITIMTASGWAQAYTRIVSPVQAQCVPGPDVKVQFEAGGIRLAPGGYSLHFKLDDEPFQVKYDGNRAHVFKNVMPGTHTVRMYVANAQHEAVPGTLSTVTFNVAHGDYKNLPLPGQPMLTWNLPQGEYLGADAASVTLDFLLTNATLSPGGLQVAYYVDGRRFLIQDNCYIRHIKDLAPGLHRIRIELQDANGDLINGPFNSGERVIAISPYSTEKSPSLLDGTVPSGARIDSIPGAMTLGGPRPQPVRGLTEIDVEKQSRLTVNKEGQTLRLDGSVISEDLSDDTNLDEVRVQSGAVDRGVPGPAEGYTVRQGGQPETAVDLDADDSDNIRRGRIVVREADENDDDDDGTEAPDADDDDNEAPVAGTAQPEGAQTTRPLVRRRATGTTTTVERTTETLRLGERPSLRQSTTETTRTVRAADAESTATRNADTRSTGTRSGDRPTTAGRRQFRDGGSTTGSARRRESSEDAEPTTASAAADAARRRERRARQANSTDRVTTRSAPADVAAPANTEN